MKLSNEKITELKQKLFAAMEKMKTANLEQAKEIASSAIGDLKKSLSGYDVDKMYLDTLQMSLDNNIKSAQILQDAAKLPGNLTDEAKKLQKQDLAHPYAECLKIAIGVMEELKAYSHENKNDSNKINSTPSGN